jgi:hypothetical protein
MNSLARDLQPHGNRARRRRLPAQALGFALALALASRSARAQSDSTWRDHDRALQAARQANDTVTYRAQLDAIYREVGATQRIAMRYASLALGAHDTAAASRWMQVLAAMGDELDTGLVSRYAALAGAPAARALQASHARASADAGSPSFFARLPDADMISEDLAYDARAGRFLVSSVHRGGICAIANGRTTTFVQPGANGTWGIFALGVDTARNTLWATTGVLPMAARYSTADSGRSALLEYDLRTGALRHRFVAPDTGAHVLGDMVLGSSGAVYVSDGLGGGVYALAPNRDSLRVLVPQGMLRSPQTPALSRDGATLFVPDYSIGIAAVDVASGRLAWITHSDSLALTGIDGLYRMGRDLIVVQNGLEPNRIMRLTLDESMRHVTRATVVARGPSAQSLTHATIVREWLYFITKSGWERTADDGKMTAAASAADAPTIVRVRIAP